MTSLEQYLKQKRGAKPRRPGECKTLIMDADAYEVVRTAHKRMMELEQAEDITIGQAVERICADWLAGN